ncbi:MAG: response regulator [Terracidiphilus sp.]
MNFPTVPIRDITRRGLLADTSAYRPIVLVVDDESAIADTLSEILNRSGYASIAAYDGESALETALVMPPDLAIIDAGLPGMSGTELAIALRSRLSDCRILLLFEQSAARTAPAFTNHAGHEFERLDRPVHPDNLLAFVGATFK